MDLILRTSDKSIPPRASLHAADYGSLAALQWLHHNNCPWDARVIITAAERDSGHLDIARLGDCLQMVVSSP
jgi:hypothetical protein